MVWFMQFKRWNPYLKWKASNITAKSSALAALNSGEMQLESAASRSAPLPWCRPDSLWCLSGDSDSKVSLHPALCPLNCQGLEVSFSFPENRYNLHRNKGEYKISRGWPKQWRQGSSTGLSECDRAAAEAFHTYRPQGLVKHGHARLYLSAAPTADVRRVRGGTWKVWQENWEPDLTCKLLLTCRVAWRGEERPWWLIWADGQTEEKKIGVMTRSGRVGWGRTSARGEWGEGFNQGEADGREAASRRPTMWAASYHSKEWGRQHSRDVTV